MIKIHNYTKLVIGYLLLLTILCVYMVPSHDILFYYYPWSTHLQLSYYDGPPLIAYIIRLITLVFGQNMFALNFFGVIIISLSCYVIFKIGELLQNAQLGIIAAALWLVYPFSTTRFIFITLNYDCLDNLFSLASVLFILRYLRHKNVADIYYSSLMLGVLLLAKYTGIILIFGLVIYLLLNLRQLFRNIHFYAALLLVLVIFSPVLIWNYQHEWISFRYQLSAHSWNTSNYVVSRYGFAGVIFYIFSDVLGVMHLILLALLMMFLGRHFPLWRGCKEDKPTMLKLNSGVIFGVINNHGVRLLITIIATYFVFWLIISYFAHVAMNYLLPMDSLLIILCCYYLCRYQYIKVIHVFIVLFLIISIIMVVDRTFVKTIDKNDIIKFNQLHLYYGR